MAVFTKLRKKDIDLITDWYGLEVLAFKEEPGGSANTNYRLETREGKQFMMTINEASGFSTAGNLVDLLNLLSKNNFETSHVIPTLQGEFLTTFHEKPLFIKNLIPGEVVDELSPFMLEQAGRETALLHQVPAPDFLPKEHAFGYEIFPTVFGKNVEPKFENWLENQFQIIKNNFPKDLPQGIIHGDLFEDNILFQEESLTAIIDFECACIYPFAFDLGMAFVGICQTDGVIDLLKTKAFLKGYEAIRKLMPVERMRLKFFTNYAATSIAFWRFRQYRIDKPNYERRNKHLLMLRLIEDLSTKEF